MRKEERRREGTNESAKKKKKEDYNMLQDGVKVAMMVEEGDWRRNQGLQMSVEYKE